ncbi:MAG: hypothetical protein Q4G69_12295 [Planctomycetia bacterium]|nr:hypothetical protein [Planctomycetia bacterium]
MFKWQYVPFCIFLIFWSVRGSAQEPITAKKVLSANLEYKSIPVHPGDGRPYMLGFTQEKDGSFLCDNKDKANEHRGVYYPFTLNQKKATPIIASLESRAENVGGSSDPDYSLYIDVQYADGTSLYGQTGSFETGTHQWEKQKVLIVPTKPIRSLAFYGLFRNHTGKAQFKNFQLGEMKFAGQCSTFDTVPVSVFKNQNKLQDGSRTLQIRDLERNSDFLFTAPPQNGIVPKSQVLDLSINTSREESEFGTILKIELEDLSGKDRFLTLVYSVQIPDREIVWFENPRKSVPAVKGSEYVNASAMPLGSSGRLSEYPFGVVGWKENGKDQGAAIGLTPDSPCFFRIGYHAEFSELYLSADLALTPEKSKAVLKFVDFSKEFVKGSPNLFRSALSYYYRWFPWAFQCRTAEQGIWMPFQKISSVEGWEDFGFKFKEGDNETAWDDAHDITTFRYTEPMTWWMRMDKDAPRTLEGAVEQAKTMAAKGNKSAQSLLTCGHFDAKGQYTARLMDTPWCNGAVWSMCDLPGLVPLVHQKKITWSDQYPTASMDWKWSPEIFNRLYPARSGDSGESDLHKGLDGEYIDSSEGYVTAVLNYRREHFPAVNTPLVFSKKEKKPGIFKGLLVYEYVKKIADDVHSRGRLMMANGAPSRLFWLVPLMDVCGTETDWNRNNKWSPMSDEALLYRRSLCAGKPYCFLMNTNFDQFSYDLSEKFMQRSLAYGMFPGYFSANASTGHYFERPDIYNRDRPLFKKYIPLCKAVAEAGWQPITGASSDLPDVYVEQFGNKPNKIFFTVFNDSKERKTVKITFDPRWKDFYGASSLADQVSGNSLPVKNGSVSLELGPENVAVLTTLPNTKGK